MLYLIGLGINDENDLSMKGLEMARKCDKIFMETYTNKWHGDLDKLKEMIGKDVLILNRENVEDNHLVDEAKENNIALFVCGDPLSATTHTELISEAIKKKVDYRVIHSSSVLTAVGETGLHLYKFGRTTTLCYPEGNYKPTSPLDMIKKNKENGLHTLVLLDVKDDEKRYMTVKEGVKILLDTLKKDEKIIAASCLGSDKRKMKYSTAENIMKEDFETPAVIIIPGELNFKEEEFLRLLE
ncbi:diphthine synthase [Candidatus Aenigmatarchaeota archaeon]